jgi:hypothetical protein
MRRVAAGLVLVAALMAGNLGARALWVDRFDPTGAPLQGLVSLAAQRDGGTTSRATGTALAQAAVLRLEPADAEGLWTGEGLPGGVALPFRVMTGAVGAAGLAYSIVLPDFTAKPDTRFGTSVIRVWQTASDADCTVANMPENSDQLTGVVGLPGGQGSPYAGYARQAEQHWCLAAVPWGEWTYENTATARGITESGQVVDNSQQAAGANRDNVWSTGITSPTTAGDTWEIRVRPAVIKGQ